jgi:hypothetical protein
MIAGQRDINRCPIWKGVWDAIYRYQSIFITSRMCTLWNTSRVVPVKNT